jgi:hypothetical protein
VHPGDRPWRERGTIASPTATEVAVEVVDVLRCQLDDVEVAEIGLEMAVDDRARVTRSGDCPTGSSGLEPQVEEVRERARTNSCSSRLP